MSIYLPIAGVSADLLILLGLGLAVGFMSGMFGIGGGFIMTPLLIAINIPPAVAVSTGAASVMASGVSGALAQWKRGNVDLRLGVVLLLGGALGAVIGVRCLTLLRRFGQLDLAVGLLFSFMLGVVGTLMLIESLNSMLKARRGAPVSARRAGQHAWFEKLPLKQRFATSRIYMSILPPLLLGAFVGLLTGIMGIGGGFITVPALVYMFRAPTRIAVGTSLFQVVFVAGLTTLLHAGVNHTIDVVLAVPIMLGGVIGAQFGATAGSRLNAQQLRSLLAVVVLIAAARMALGLALTPSELFQVDAAP